MANVVFSGGLRKWIAANFLTAFQHCMWKKREDIGCSHHQLTPRKYAILVITAMNSHMLFPSRTRSVFFFGPSGRFVVLLVLCLGSRARAGTSVAAKTVFQE